MVFKSGTVVLCCRFGHVRPCVLEPTRLLCSWGCSGKNTGVGCNALLLNQATQVNLGFPGDSVVKNPPDNAGDVSSIQGVWKDPPGEGNGNPFQYPYLGNPMDRGA